jgi:general stress protein 26
MTKEELLRILDELLPPEPNPTMFLATRDDRWPHVRPLSLARDGCRFYCASARCSDKARQITAHPEVEFVALLRRGENTGYLRVEGRAVEIKGKPLHEAWARGRGYDTKRYFPGGLDDSELVAYRIEPTRVHLLLAGKMDEEALPPAWFA